MFRFGFKNRQREMLGITITELRELKAELSDLKEQLRQIIPGGTDDTQKQELPAGERWDYADTADGEYPGLGEEYFSSPARDPGKGQEEPCNIDLETVAGAFAGAAVAVTEAACGSEEGGEEVGKADQAGSEEILAVGEGSEKASLDRREWAVVNYQTKEPWWKLWGRRGRIYGDYSGGGPQ
ncbi:MAG: hypothetical protein JL50_14170 [Peptococcaceae bacterium BICA1-7]|nr:MAG: hypothetical protein JL50_14170 [Peptococcaceae bacterium BICA1-7]HBV96413.1 hypothetical protein [Desulfotomaculum sp.]